MTGDINASVSGGNLSGILLDSPWAILASQDAGQDNRLPFCVVRARRGGGETTERAVDSLTHVSIEWSRWESSGGPESRRQAGRAPRDSMPSREWHTK